MHSNSNKQQGFSLVEVSLAILVMAVGLLTVFALFPIGLKQGREAEGDTRAAMFAEYLFNSLQAANSYTSWSNMHQNVDIEPIAPNMWATNTVIEVRSSAANGVISYWNLEINTNSVVRTKYEQYTLRYELTVTNFSTLTGKGVQLTVFPQEYGTNGMQIFYTEIPYKGRL